MADTDKEAQRGVDVAGLLLVVFIVLKLTNVIEWRWVWVLAPAWMPLALFAVIFGIIMLVYAIVNVCGRCMSRPTRVKMTKVEAAKLALMWPSRFRMNKIKIVRNK